MNDQMFAKRIGMVLPLQPAKPHNELVVVRFERKLWNFVIASVVS